MGLQSNSFEDVFHFVFIRAILMLIRVDRRLENDMREIQKEVMNDNFGLAMNASLCALLTACAQFLLGYGVQYL
jgi:hypothetical protein